MEGYVDALVRTAFRLTRKDFPSDVRRHGLNMLQHLLRFRHEELNISEWSTFVEPVEPFKSSELDLKIATAALIAEMVWSDEISLLNDLIPSFLSLSRKGPSEAELIALVLKLISNDRIASSAYCEVNPTKYLYKRLSFLESDSSESSSNVGTKSQKSSRHWTTESDSSESSSSTPTRTSSPISVFDTQRQQQNGLDDDADKSGVPAIGGKMPGYQGKGRLLLAEHNLLSEAFTIVISCSRIQQDKELLTYLIYTLNKIWTQPEWEKEYMQYPSRLTRLLSNVQFMKTVYSLVKCIEEELKKSRTKESCATQQICSSTFTTYLHLVAILPLFLPPLLRLLQCIHALWNHEVADDLSEVLQGATRSMSSKELAMLLDETNELSDIDEEEELKEIEIRKWLQGIRESGYNVLGLCASIEGAFSELLDIPSVGIALMENVGYMEFRHLRLLIHLVVIPLVKHCPCKFWEELTMKLLQPFFHHCEKVLNHSWFNLLHGDRAKVRYYFGGFFGSEEMVRKMELERLLEFTREISTLLGVLASPKLNSGLLHVDLQPNNNRNRASCCDLEFISSISLVGHFLLGDCFWRLNMNLFGCWFDSQAAKEAIPFCHALIRIAVATNDGVLCQFIIDDLLPSIVKRLCNDLRCAVQQLSCKLNSRMSEDVRKDLLVLCREIHEIYIENQVVAGEQKASYNTVDNFKDWLANQMEDLRMRASSAPPEEFPKELVWNWEFEEEIQRYLPVYLHMLREVDAMDDCLEDQHLSRESLFKQLKPEFKSKYCVSSCVHPHVRTMSNMLERKMSTVYYQRFYGTVDKFLRELITLRPYIQRSDDLHDVIGRLKENCETEFELFHCETIVACEIFLGSILFYWEPQCHPLIREGNKDKLIELARQLTLAKEREIEPLEPDPIDFLEHLKPYAWTYIKIKKEGAGYHRAKEQVRLHEEFDRHLASGELDCYMDEFTSSKADFVKKVADNKIVESQFADLDHDLIRLSLERRAKIVDWQHQMCSYSKCLRDLLENEKLKGHLKSMMSELEAEGFFNINDDNANWEKKCCLELLDKFNAQVFAGNSLPKHYVIRGIMDYWTILSRKDLTWQDAFKKVVGVACSRWTENLPEFWMDTRHYEHLYYDIIREPLKKVFV